MIDRTAFDARTVLHACPNHGLRSSGGRRLNGRGEPDEERNWVRRLKELDPAVRQTVERAEELAPLVRDRDGVELDNWLSRVSVTPALQAFAAGFRRDEAARRAGLTRAWSNGPVEGAVNRLKFLKRAGYGRAKFDLLRARVLHAD